MLRCVWYEHGERCKGELEPWDGRIAGNIPENGTDNRHVIDFYKCKKCQREFTRNWNWEKVPNSKNQADGFAD